MYTSLSASRNYLYNVSRASDRGHVSSKDCAGVLLFAAENSIKVALDTIQCLGGLRFLLLHLLLLILPQFLQAITVWASLLNVTSSSPLYYSKFLQGYRLPKYSEISIQLVYPYFLRPAKRSPNFWFPVECVLCYVTRSSGYDQYYINQFVSYFREFCTIFYCCSQFLLWGQDNVINLFDLYRQAETVT